MRNQPRSLKTSALLPDRVFYLEENIQDTGARKAEKIFYFSEIQGDIDKWCNKIILNSSLSGKQRGREREKEIMYLQYVLDNIGKCSYQSDGGYVRSDIDK